MTVLILTADSSSAGALREAARADVVIPLELRLVWGPPKSDAELAEFVVTRTTQPPGSHWLDHVSSGYMKKFGGSDFALIEFCERCDTVELWMETDPNAQLVLIWLLTYLRTEAKSVTHFQVRYVDSSLSGVDPKHLANLRFDVVPVTSDLLETASLAWRAYRSSTPQDWFGLLNRNLSVLPQLRRCVLEMLEELPWRATGLGASETRILELISTGYDRPFALFPHLAQRFQRRVFGYWEVGSLLEGLALAPVPAISGLAEWPFEPDTHNLRDRYERYKASKLSLTPLGKAILEQADDFSRHNPIHRWWGGTELTNDRLWRWDPVLIAP